MNWLTRHAAPLEALAALITAGVALAALVAIPLQIRATAQLQAEQSGRDIYREFMSLSVQQPQFAEPDYCALKENPKQLTSYSYYVEYLLYTAEQVAELSDDWSPVMAGHLEQHRAFACDNPDWRGDSAQVAGLLLALRQNCPVAPSC